MFHVKHLCISFCSNIFKKLKSKLFHVKQSRELILKFKEKYIKPSLLADVNYIIFEIMCMIDEILDIFLEFDL